MDLKIVGETLLKVRLDGDDPDSVVLAWGDRLLVGDAGGGRRPVVLRHYLEDADGGLRSTVRTGSIPANTQLIEPDDNPVLSITFVDVGQGDAAVIRTPGGRLLVIDGGENQLLARYLASRYALEHHTADTRLDIDALIVTHGDADHFEGLRHMKRAETHPKVARRIFVHPRRVYHNGLIKGPSTLDEDHLLGTPTVRDGQTYVPLFEDPIEADTPTNAPFNRWIRALRGWRDEAGPIEFHRLDHERSDLLATALGEEADSIDLDVLWPRPELVDGEPMLPMLRATDSTVFRAEDDPDPEDALGGSVSASHTINGHSVVMKLRYGKLRVLFTGDLNSEAQDDLVEDGASLRAEILKVPHHGSDDFSGTFLRRVRPVASVISSGDQPVRGDYMHPRVNLIGALGRESRVRRPLIFITELAAFLKPVGWVQAREYRKRNGQWTDDLNMTATPKDFFAFRREAVGTVHVRTDGRRVLMFTDSGKRDAKDGYVLDLAHLSAVRINAAPSAVG